MYTKYLTAKQFSDHYRLPESGELDAVVVVDFARRVYLNLNIQASRELVLIFMLQEVKRHRDAPRIQQLMGAMSLKEFRLMPNQKHEFLAMLTTV